MAIWGIDLGGTKIEGAILASPDKPDTILRQRIDTEADKGYEHVLDRIALLLEQMSAESGISPERLGIGTPGALDPATELLKNSNSTALNGMPFKKDLETRLGIPVAIANDANCFALAETRMGIVPDIDPNAGVVFGVIMGSGVGGGVVVDGKVINGHHGIGGEWGHNFLDESGGQCYCGRVGCVEKVLSGRNLEQYHEATFGNKRKLKDIYASHLAGNDEEASHTINRLVTFFGRALAVVINILDPDVIVIGGGVGNIDLLYSAGIEEVKKYTFNPTLETKIVKPKLGDSAGVFGAAFLVA
jgi:fructokinase